MGFCAFIQPNYIGGWRFYVRWNVVVDGIWWFFCALVQVVIAAYIAAVTFTILLGFRIGRTSLSN
ncbi:MAG: hypothetical protein R3E90_00120 [Marinicella sp.]